MKITHISDTHNKHNGLNGKLPGGDLLIHSGDISSLGREREVTNFVKWFNRIDNYTNKVFIAGNHDMSFDSEILLRRKLAHFDSKTNWDTPAAIGKPQWLEVILKQDLDSNVFYLENSDVTIDGIKIWGSPVSPSFGYGWGFNVDRGEGIKKVWDLIPDDVGIVITHGPIYGYCDVVQRDYSNVGCNDLFSRLVSIKPHLHFSGHIHEAYGYKAIEFGDWNGYAFNGCTCNLRYEPDNPPITFNYDFETKIIDFI